MYKRLLGNSQYMRRKIGEVLIGFLFTALLTPAYANEGFFSWLFSFSRHKEVENVADTVYTKECGSCHMPYQPGLLPEKSWQRILDANKLADHFGENAELDDETRQHILRFLSENSAEKSYYKRSKKIMASISGENIPLRISETEYFRNKHEEIPLDFVKKNEHIKSFSFCNHCHKKALNAVYDDDTVVIPKN